MSHNQPLSFSAASEILKILILPHRHIHNISQDEYACFENQRYFHSFHPEVWLALISFNQKLKRQNAPFSLHQSASTDNMSRDFHLDPTLTSRL